MLTVLVFPFLVPAAAGAPAPEIHPGASDCASNNGMFRRSPSLAIPHRRSFAGIPCVSLPKVRVVETVVLENGRFVLSPAENRWFRRKLAKILIVHSAHKNKGFCSSDPEIDENDGNSGCHSSNMTVCQKHRFDNPDKGPRHTKTTTL